VRRQGITVRRALEIESAALGRQSEEGSGGSGGSGGSAAAGGGAGAPAPLAAEQV
jgi:hypothetical protein